MINSLKRKRRGIVSAELEVVGSSVLARDAM